MRTCLICDDHAMMRQALAGSVEMAWPEVSVSLASDFPAAWAAAANGPELILCDLGMPGAGPVAGIQAMRTAAPSIPLIVITANEDDRILLELFDCGIAGFIPKTSTGELIEAAIRVVLAGGRYLPPRIADLAREGAKQGQAPPDGGPRTDQIARLTQRQVEVLRLISDGESNKEIARALTLSPATVKAHVAAVIAVLGATNRTEAAARARETGLI